MSDNQRNPFWQYSLALYGRPKVAECCLSYQDNDGANVNLLLFCCWLGFSGHRIEPEALEQARSLIEAWDLQAVQKLRAIRRFLVSSQCTSSEMVKSDVVKGEMIQSLQQVELMAEQVVQNILYDWWLGESFCHSHEHGAALQTERLQAENLNTYLDTLGCQPIPTDSPLLCPLDEPQTST
ncbi:MAG: TIGR02444 family protein [Porticoccus sp.]|nr:TIGR02444 family protein [Porticoccus sp.]